MIQLLMRWIRKSRRRRIRKSFDVVLLLVAILTYGTTGFMFFEIAKRPDLTWGDAAWWAIVTTTTVGYGDYFPETNAGRLFVGLPTMLLGVSMLGYLLSLLATILLESRFKELRGASQMRFSDHVIVIHYNSLEETQQLIAELRGDAIAAAAPVVLIDESLEELPERLREQEVYFVRGNPARESTLEQAAFRDCRYLLLRANAGDPSNSDARNLTVALTIERLCPTVRTAVHCVEPENAVFFERAGVDSVICPSALSMQLMVQELQDPGTHAVLSELTSNVHGRQIFVVPGPQTATNAAQLHAECRRDGAVLLGLQRDGKNLLLPRDEEPIAPDDKLIIVGSTRPGQSGPPEAPRKPRRRRR